MSNGIYDILGKIASLVSKDEPKQEAKQIYESVEAKGSVLEGVNSVEARLTEKYVAEKAVSKAQQKFMGMVHATQKGEKAPSKEVAKVAKSMGKKDAKDFASTKHKGLPQHVAELAELCPECGMTECSCVHEASDYGWDHPEKKEPTVRKVTGKYGTEYQGDPDEDEEEQRKVDTGTRTRGRPRKHAKVEKVPGRGRGRPKAEKPPFSGKNSAAALTNILFGKAPKNRVTESRMLDETGEALEHILNRFKAEVKAFEQGAELDKDLYDALYDYYVDMAEMPYGVQKARTGDPYNWVTDKLDSELFPDDEQNLDIDMNKHGIDPEGDYEGVEECGATTAGAVATAPVRSLEEEMAELVELAKLAGVAVQPTAVKEANIEVSEPDEEPVNAPEEEYQTIKASTLNPGEGDNGEKQMNPDRPTFKNGDNALSKPPVRAKEPTLEARLAAEYESIKKVSK